MLEFGRILTELIILLFVTGRANFASCLNIPGPLYVRRQITAFNGSRCDVVNSYGLPRVAIYIALANSEVRVLSDPYARKPVLVYVALLQSSRTICQDQNTSRFSLIDPTSSNNRIGRSPDAQFLVLLVS